MFCVCDFIKIFVDNEVIALQLLPIGGVNSNLPNI